MARYKINSGHDRKKIIPLIILIVLISFNLRAPITGVGSLINIIREEFSLSPGEAGLLTTLPLLAFAAVSPSAGLLARRFGAGRVFIIGSAVLMIGILIRSCFGRTGIFAGTVIIGAAIAIGNVLLPAVIKSIFPDRIGVMTSLYTVIMQVVSSFSTAVCVPVSMLLGWRWALGIWLIPAAAALIACIITKDLSLSDQNIMDKSTVQTEGFSREKTLLKNRMTWWITLYMGVQSMMFYSFIAWLSPMMQDKGYDAVMSGYLLSLYVIMGMAGSAALPYIMRCCRNQSVTGTVLGTLYLIGMVNMMLSSYMIMMLAGIIICGFCSGACVSFSMALFGFHTSNGSSASELSGTAQSGGYLIAAAGPVFLGRLFDITGSWNIPIAVLMSAAVFLVFAGRITGRDEIIK